MDPITNNILIFTILSVVILMAGPLSLKTRIPEIVLLMFAGAVLGENGLGLLRRNTAITLFGEVGLVYIMFLSGLEIDLYEFARKRGRSVIFGILTFLIPQGLGTLLVWRLLGASIPASFLIASMFASHTLLTYPIASRLGVHKTEPVTITVGGTIVANVLSLLVLAVVMEVHRGGGMTPQFWIGISAGMAALLLLTWFGIPRLARWFFQNITESGGSQFMFVIGVTCACAYLSTYARMEPIIGAFLAGAAFNRLVPTHSQLMNRIEFAGGTLFIPFFLISVGMLINPQVLLRDPRSWGYVSLMAASVVATKLLAAWLTGRLFRYRREEWMMMFGLSVVQAASTLAAALVGFKAGIVDEAALNGAVGMILVSVILGAWATNTSGRELARGRLSSVQSFGASEQRILISVANPVSAVRLMDFALLLRDPARACTFLPVTIVREVSQNEEAVARGEALLARCLSHGAASGQTVLPGVRMDLNPADGITRAANELRANLVLAGWGGELTTSARIFGTVSLNLVERCPSRLWLSRILVPPNTNNRILLALPPLFEHRLDLAEFVGDIKRLSRQVGGDLRVYADAATAARVRERLESARPSCPVVWREEATWVAARELLFKEVAEDAMLILPHERKNSALWSPASDRLPEVIAEKFPRINFVVAYPQLAQADVAIPALESTSTRCGFPRMVGVNVPREMDADAALLHLLRVGLGPDDEAIGDSYAQLVLAARHHGVDLPGDGLLLHAHAGSHEEPLLLVGYGLGDHPFFGRATPPRFLLALVSPRGLDATVHLRTLTAIARRFQSLEQDPSLLQADSAESLCSSLLGSNPDKPDGATQPPM